MVFDIIADLSEMLKPHIEDETERMYFAWQLLYVFNQTQGELLSLLGEMAEKMTELTEAFNQSEIEVDRLRRVIANIVSEYGDIIKLVESQVIDEAHMDVKIDHEESV